METNETIHKLYNGEIYPSSKTLSDVDYKF